MIWIFSLAIWFFYSFMGLQAQEPSALTRELNTVFKSYQAKAGVSVVDGAGREVYSYNSKKSFQPASIAKLVSTACGLKTLGPEYKFETIFSHTGNLAKGVLHGDLVIKGGGDFSFVIENLKMITEQLRYVYGIKEIKGSLVFDTSYFSKSEFPLSEGFKGDKGRSFRALLTAAPLNHNSFSIWLRPNGSSASISVFPKGAVDLKVSNTVKIVSGRLNASKLGLDYRPVEKKLFLSGKIGNRDSTKVYYRALMSPYESFANLFRENFSALGGKWGGSHRLVSSVPQSKRLIKHRSRSLWRLLVDVNKLSTNFGAEMTALAAAKKTYSSATSPEKVKSFLKDCVREQSFNANQIHLENASGLSRKSSLQPAALSRFLYKQSFQQFWPEYLSTLSVLGRDGTTRSRSLGLGGSARLKTGSINGVRSISGVVYASNSEPYFVTAILNCASCSSSNWRKAENQLIERLGR